MIFFIAIIVAMIVIYAYQFLIDPTFLPRILVHWVIIPLSNLPFWSILLFFGLMVLQAIIAPIPSEMVLLMTGLLWTLAGGAVVGFIGSMISGIIGYYIARRGGRPLAVNALGIKTVDSLEYYMSKYGFYLVILARAVPVVPFDLFTIASGFTQMKFKNYTIATAIGTIPRAIFYSWAGFQFAGSLENYINLVETDPEAALLWLENNAIIFNIFLAILTGSVVGGFAIFYFIILPYMKKKYEKEKDNQTSFLKIEKLLLRSRMN
ncbi:MAG: TVP38/TMEM64 family protein [Promethearchaeota archaeon]|nr:MAG: TVP38/TMEM64 family protein [Candidatus Lokiarchaeota archaeon]